MAATPIGITTDTLITTINGIYTALQTGIGLDLSLPPGIDDIDLITDPPEFSQYPVAEIPQLTLESLTEGDNTLCGSGAFDTLMRAVNKHLESQFRKGTISQTEATKVYVTALEMAMGQAVSYLVASNQAAWNGEKAKREAELLEIQKAIVAQDYRTRIFETIAAKMNMGKIRVDAYKAVGELVATKVAIGDTYYNIQQKDLQSELVIEQIDAARAQTKLTMRPNGAIPGESFKGILQHKITEAEHQAALVRENVDAAASQTKETLYSSDFSSPVLGSISLDKELKVVQKSLLLEQVDSAMAQTKDTVESGAPVVGILGAQRELYKQQKESYVHDSMNKAAKLSSEAWSTMKTIDEATNPPEIWNIANIGAVVRKYFNQVGVDDGVIDTGTPG